MANGKAMKRLVISRRNRERVYIGDAVVQVEWFPGRASLIKVTIDAPEEITVLREELVDGKKGDKNEKFHHRFHTRIDREQDQNQSQKRSGD